MPRLCYIFMTVSTSVTAALCFPFTTTPFLWILSCIILPNLRILVPDRIVPFDQALHLASSCHGYLLSLYFFFFLAQLFIFSFSIFSFPFLPTLPSGNQYIYFLLFSSFLGLPKVSLKIQCGRRCLLAGHPVSPWWPGPCAALPVSILFAMFQHISFSSSQLTLYDKCVLVLNTEKHINSNYNNPPSKSYYHLLSTQQSVPKIVLSTSGS